MTIITNLVPNPYFSVGTTGWAINNGALDRDTDYAYAGPASGLMTADGTNAGVQSSVPLTLPVSAHYIWTVVRNNAAATRTITLRDGASILATTSVGAGEVVTFGAGFTGTGTSRFYRVRAENVSTGDSFNIGTLQITPGDSQQLPCPEIDAAGNLLPGSEWLGTPHNSTSTRDTAHSTAPRPSRVFVLGSPHNIGPMKVGRR